MPGKPKKTTSPPKPERVYGLFENGSAGIITLDVWLCLPNGETATHFWAPVWDITSDATFPVEGFRSTEHWQAIARDEDGGVLAVIPGCKVCGWVAAGASPPNAAGRNVCNLANPQP